MGFDTQYLAVMTVVSAVTLGVFLTFVLWLGLKARENW
jgi:hypothetical protein